MRQVQERPRPRREPWRTEAALICVCCWGEVSGAKPGFKTRGKKSGARPYREGCKSGRVETLEKEFKSRKEKQRPAKGHSQLGHGWKIQVALASGLSFQLTRL